MASAYLLCPSLIMCKVEYLSTHQSAALKGRSQLFEGALRPLEDSDIYIKFLTVPN